MATFTMGKKKDRGTKCRKLGIAYFFVIKKLYRKGVIRLQKRSNTRNLLFYIPLLASIVLVAGLLLFPGIAKAGIINLPGSATYYSFKTFTYPYVFAETINFSSGYVTVVNRQEIVDSSVSPAPVQNNTITPEPAAKPMVEKKVLAKGTKDATELYIIKAGKPGPTVMIVGGIHGNETAGYKAAEKFINYDLKRGTLLIIPRANQRAIENKSRMINSVGDMNRQFPTSSSSSADTVLTREIYKVVKDYKVVWLMDMHESIDYHKLNPDSVGQTLIYYPANSTRSTVSNIVDSINRSVNYSYAKFTLLRYPAKGSLARAAGEYLGVHSFIFETCSKQSLSTRIDYQVKAANLLLKSLAMN